MQVVRKCTGYCFCAQSGILHGLLLVTTIGVSVFAPQLAIWLLLRKCPLSTAEFVRVKVNGTRQCVFNFSFCSSTTVLDGNLCLWCLQFRNGKQHLLRITLLSSARLPAKQQVGITIQSNGSTGQDCSPYVSDAGYEVQVANIYKHCLQWINQHCSRGHKPVYRVFRLTAQLYIYHADLSAFLPLDDMPSNMPQQIWSAVEDLAGIDSGVCIPHTALQAQPHMQAAVQLHQHCTIG